MNYIFIVIPNKSNAPNVSIVTKEELYYDNGKSCASCYHTRFQDVNVNSGNQEIDNLINNQFKFKLEWIPFHDFIDIKRIRTGGFS
ncbi:hypothetical protein F8M41_026428 [Gigaspora margarita]|uniref:Uncharacterized protein n=1 Tax=Gigaspora margarita TaxID=4874 RepID=A0A8H4AB54_GIGMA|nr:hypothetical protein F8M41_026428 [Gigaspora margarita]